MKIQSINPFDLSVNAEFDELSDKQLEEILKNSLSAFSHWKEFSYNQRSQLFLSVADNLLKEKTDLAKTITIEMGKPIKEAVAEIEKCAAVCTYYANSAEDILKSEIINTDALKSYVAFEPLGCILAVMPWNFPFWQVFRFAAPALMSGNVGILKHASNVPLCSLAIQKIFLNSGFPVGVFQSCIVGANKIPLLISSDIVKAITLTGSEKAGSEVASLAGKFIKKTVLELGGNDPFIVFEDADINKAAAIAVKSRMVNSGQSCIAAKRFIIHKNIYAQFIQLFQENIDKLKVGNPLDNETDLGPLARKDLLDELISKINLSIAKGAVIHSGGHVNKDNPNFMEPTIIANVKPSMGVYSEELFGPVAVIHEFETEEEAIFLANDTKYGLGASIWTANIENAEKLAQKINAGCVYFNTMVSSDIRLPFGGINLSGYGRELSSYGIKEFVNIKSVKIFV